MFLLTQSAVRSRTVKDIGKKGDKPGSKGSAAHVVLEDGGLENC